MACSSQLAAVWVTTTSSSSPFQVLNTSTRKYDSLRGKYIAAYLETLRLSRRRGELETFLKWTYSCRRDLPGFFQASALAERGVPAKSHANDPLLVVRDSLSEHSFLTGVKRRANDAFAEVLANEIAERSPSNRSSPGGEHKLAERFLKLAYSSYLRLHCSRDDLNKVGAWKYGRESLPEVEAVCQAYLAMDEGADGTAGTLTGKANFGDWSGRGRKEAIFDMAITKCRAMFPNLSGTFFSNKANAAGSKSKKKSNEAEDGVKRKEPDEGAEETTTVSFEVAVPPGLSAGESFFTTVKFGGGTKKLKLTVPPSSPSTLRFSLKVPKESTPTEPPAKKPRNDSDAPDPASEAPTELQG